MQSSLLHAEPATIQQQDQARHEQLAPQGKPLLTAESTSKGDALVLPKESVCYDIRHVRIDNTQSLPHWLTFRDVIRQAENNCIGVKGIKAIHTAVQDRLISHGFITTRVLIPEQNLHKGTLTLQILPGRVSDVIIQDQSGLPVHRGNNVPQAPGDLLDLRGLEQGLENLQRIPGSQASIRLMPGENPGDTRVEIKRDQRKAWRLGSWFDDSGSKYTGRYQGAWRYIWITPPRSTICFMQRMAVVSKMKTASVTIIARRFTPFPGDTGRWNFMPASTERHRQSIAVIFTTGTVAMKS